MLMSAEGTLVAEVAHIAAESEGGPRWDAKLSQEERRGFENLLLLCPTCHTLVDKDPVKYKKSTLRQWKRDREARFEAIGDLLQKSYLNEITDDANTIGATLPKDLAAYTSFLTARGETPFIDEDTPREIADYVEKLRHLVAEDRQLMVAVIEKALALGGRRESEHGITVHIDDLKTIRINHSRLSSHRIGKLAKTLDRHNLGSIDADDQEYELFISGLGNNLSWSELMAFAESKGTTLHALLVDLKFGLLD
ncbi:hypothetical protein EAH76_03180 [Sphingomonas glacialis]|uniref:HNH endonuclease n=1 Tax=Sphingomonas glacialis TaxID=658225 RepID=A0A502G564_9SPHN|nr:hypothetical protein EAH76_03180 [Sphingomonas glacialis]